MRDRHECWHAVIESSIATEIYRDQNSLLKWFLGTILTSPNEGARTQLYLCT